MDVKGGLVVVADPPVLASLVGPCHGSSVTSISSEVVIVDSPQAYLITIMNHLTFLLGCFVLAMMCDFLAKIKLCLSSELIACRCDVKHIHLKVLGPSDTVKLERSLPPVDVFVVYLLKPSGYPRLSIR